MKRTRLSMKVSAALGVIIAGMLLLCTPLTAQRVKSSLTGMVADPAGAAVSNADVTLRNEGTNAAVTFKTGGDGIYTFPFLDAGSYSLKTTAAGFSTLERTGITIRVSTDERVDLGLQMGSVSEVVNVAGKSPLLETVSSTLGQTIESKYLRDIPLNGRNVFSLLNTLPGSTLGAGRFSSATNPGVNGQDGRGNSYTLDGMSINQEYGGFSSGSGVAYTPSLDGIAEFKAVTNNFSAEYGRALSSVVSLNLKSGTNAFHGTAYEFLRNDALNARNYFASATAKKPVLRYNQFGFSIGGPIVKNKLFFFTDTEWLRNLGEAVVINSVPTDAMRSGDFSSDPNVIYDPATTRNDSSGQAIRDPFPGNIIPADRISPIAQTIMDFWPEPNLPGDAANYRSVSGTSTLSYRHDTKVDYNLSARDTLSGRFSYSDATVQGAKTLPGPGNPNATAYQHTTTPGFQINETHIFSPQVVNEFRAGFQKNSYMVLGDPAAAVDWRSQLGLPLLFEDPELQKGFPLMAPSGITSLGTPYDFFMWVSRTTQFNDTLSWSKGKHFIKLGGSFSRISSQDRIPYYPAGGYEFSGGFTNLPGASATGRGFADFLLGEASGAHAGLLSPNGLEPRHNEMSAFLQDDYRITSKLTLNLGVRYDLATVMHTDDGTIWTYDPASNATKLADPPVPTDWNDIAPRIGFAWAFVPKTVLRGGYGISYLPQFKGLAGFMVVPPVLQASDLVAVDAFTPARTLDQDFGQFQTGALAPVPMTPSLSAGMFIQNESSSPYLQSWNLTLEHQFGDNMVVTASYVANKGTHMGLDLSDLNQLPANLLGPPEQFGGLTAQERRRYPDAGSIQEFANDFSDNYNALQVKVEWRNWHGLSALTSYTHSKALGIQNYSYIDQTYNKHASYGLTDADLPNTFVQTFTYELPFGRGRTFVHDGGVLDQFVGGWQVNGILSARDGLPFNLTSAVDQTGSFGGNSGRVRPDRLCNGTLSADDRALDHWFDTSCFAVPQPFTFGNTSVFPLRGPGLFNLDLSAFKRFNFTETKQLEFRAEAFNFTNTPGFANPNGSIGSATAGRITSLNNANRSLQFGLKFLF